MTALEQKLRNDIVQLQVSNEKLKQEVSDKEIRQAAADHMFEGMRSPKDPDDGGNRPYDYISIEEHKAAEELLKSRPYGFKYSDLTLNEIVVLRTKAKRLHIVKDIVDKIDRLALIECLLIHAENRDEWMNKYRALETQLSEANNIIEYSKAYYTNQPARDYLKKYGVKQ